MWAIAIEDKANKKIQLVTADTGEIANDDPVSAATFTSYPSSKMESTSCSAVTSSNGIATASRK